MNIDFELTPRQSEAFLALRDSAVEELAYGGAKGGGKSVLGCIWAFWYAREIARHCGISKRKFPVIVGFMGRKVSVDFNTTTLETWKQFIPPDAYRIIQHKKMIVLDESVAILYGGMDDEKTVKKFNSANLHFFFIDQAEEVSETDMGLLRGTLRQQINGKHLPYKALLTANPAICWIKPNFITTPQKGTRFIQALPSDNKFLPEGYIEQLKKAFSFRKELLNAYLYGSWDELDDAYVIIRYVDVMRAVDNKQWDQTIEKRITVCDVSYEGDDETVIYDMQNTRIANSEIYTHRDLMDTVGRIIAHQKTNKSNVIMIDVIGVGAGVYSRLCEVYAEDPTITVMQFDSRIKAGDEITYANLKAEAWFYAASLFHEQRVHIPNDTVLISQLSSVTYELGSNGRMRVTSKDKLIEKMSHSPDRADAYVMGLWAYKNAIPYKKPDRYAPHSGRDYKYRFNPMTS
jgi:phage terminase large subunit